MKYGFSILGGCISDVPVEECWHSLLHAHCALIIHFEVGFKLNDIRIYEEYKTCKTNLCMISLPLEPEFLEPSPNLGKQQRTQPPFMALSKNCFPAHFSTHIQN